MVQQLFFLQIWGGLEKTKKTKRLSKEEIKKELIDSMVNNDIIETAELNEKADNAKKAEDATAVIKQYENIIRTKEEYYMHGVPTGKSFQQI